jgi:hypothetical protein
MIEAALAESRGRVSGPSGAAAKILHQSHQIHRDHHIPPYSPHLASSQPPPYQVSSIFSGNRVALGLPSISRQSF